MHPPADEVTGKDDPGQDGNPPDFIGTGDAGVNKRERTGRRTGHVKPPLSRFIVKLGHHPALHRRALFVPPFRDLPLFRHRLPAHFFAPGELLFQGGFLKLSRQRINCPSGKYAQAGRRDRQGGKTVAARSEQAGEFDQFHIKPSK